SQGQRAAVKTCCSYEALISREKPLLRRHWLGLREPSRPALDWPARVQLWRRCRSTLPGVQSINTGRAAAIAKGGQARLTGASLRVLTQEIGLPFRLLPLRMIGTESS